MGRLARGALVLTAYAALALIVTWPLAIHLRTHLPGDPAGDTGVYVWNLWIFRHELVAHGHLPFSTRHIFGFTGGADFALHNYTAVADLLAFPLIPLVGVVGAFNVVLIAVRALSGAATYLLARQLGLSRGVSWITGALFAAMPLVSAREVAHLSLVVTGALPLFLWMLLRTIERPAWWRGAGVGTLVAVATYSDAYYGIYCVLMGVVVLAWRFLRIERGERGDRARRARRRVDGTAAVLATIAALGIASGVRNLQVGPLLIRGVNHPYAPALAVVVLGIAHLFLAHRYTLYLEDRGRFRRLVGAGTVAVVTCCALLAPLLVGIASRYASGHLPHTTILWRSSPRGVDLLAYLVPNPVHALFGQWTARWTIPPPAETFPELVASCSMLVCAIVLVAAARRQLPSLWVRFTAFFVLLSLGPFVYVGGMNTYLPGPWAVLRYVPVVGMARSPSRFAIVAALGVAVLFGFTLERWTIGRTRRAAALAAVVLAAVAFEVIPGPRPLFSAQVPDIYQFVAADQNEHGRLLELPTGIRDGTSSVGDFSARTAYFQTRHGRPVLGGYLSRVSEQRRTDNMKSPMMRALFALSEPGGTIDASAAQAARADVQEFLARSCVRFVMVDTGRASPALRAFAAESLGLVPVHADDRFELLIPESPPPCRE